MDTTFLMQNAFAAELYKKYAKNLPIIDYHNHLNIADIQSDKAFTDITELWIASDPYKHRLMRISGVEERFVTGNASAKEKFLAFCKVFPLLCGTPVYDWCRMELYFVFGIDVIPNADNALWLYDTLNSRLVAEPLTVHTIFKKFNVQYAASCVSIAEKTDAFRKNPVAAPSFRADAVLVPTKDFSKQLATLTSTEICTLEDYMGAIEKRLASLATAGCVFCDQAIDDGFRYYPHSGQEQAVFKSILAGEEITKEEQQALTCEILRQIGALYAKQNLVMLLHIGALRHTSDRLRRLAGSAGGYAGMSNNIAVCDIAALLNDIEKMGSLPKTVLFTLNPELTEAFAVLSGSFAKDGEPAVVTLGSAWWWCDHYGGMERVFEAQTHFSAISTFIGMTTDSRSPLSFVRHDYFRRVFCNWLAKKIQDGYFPQDEPVISVLIRRVCFENANNLIVKRRIDYAKQL